MIQSGPAQGRRDSTACTVPGGEAQLAHESARPSPAIDRRLRRRKLKGGRRSARDQGPSHPVRQGSPVQFLAVGRPQQPCPSFCRACHLSRLIKRVKAVSGPAIRNHPGLPGVVARAREIAEACRRSAVPLTGKASNSSPPIRAQVHTCRVAPWSSRQPALKMQASRRSDWSSNPQASGRVLRRLTAS